jgi:diguanylate cyclase (GGDEF)-like protein
VDSLFAILSMESLTVILPAVGLSLSIGFLLGRAGWRSLHDRHRQLEEQLERIGPKPGETHKREMARMRRELDTVANLALAMPSIVRELNRDDVEPEDVPRLILQLANAIFEPRQILLYNVCVAAPGSRECVLSLKAHKGLTEIPDALRTVRMGEGKIGWVAKHQLDMLREDWETLRTTNRIHVPDNHPALKADVIGPLVHYAKQRPHVLGVLCIGDPRIRPRNEKLMFQMVTNFGSHGQVSTKNMKRQRTAAHHDGLTGLLNKRCFLEDVASKSLVACERTAKPFSIFIFDIDHFKNFNDSNGHPAGDELLRRMGGLIRHHLRPGDLACRYGGEEFVIAMPDTDRRNALELAEKLRHTIDSEPFEHREKQPSGLVSISGGVASFPKDGASVNELIQHADQALYRAKKSGRNRVTQYKGIDIGDPSALPAVIEGLGDPAPGDGTGMGKVG